MEEFKKCLIVVVLLAAVVGLFGGIGYCVSIKEYAVAIAIFVLGILAFPTFKKLFEKMKE